MCFIHNLYFIYFSLHHLALRESQPLPAKRSAMFSRDLHGDLPLVRYGDQQPKVTPHVVGSVLKNKTKAIKRKIYAKLARSPTPALRVNLHPSSERTYELVGACPLLGVYEQWENWCLESAEWKIEYSPGFMRLSPRFFLQLGANLDEKTCSAVVFDGWEIVSFDANLRFSQHIALSRFNSIEPNVSVT